MLFLRFILKCTTSLILALLVAIVLYFPVASLGGFFASNTDPVPFRQNFPVEDSLLPCLALALVYAAVSAIRRRIDRAAVSGPEEKGQGATDD